MRITREYLRTVIAEAIQEIRNDDYKKELEDSKKKRSRNSKKIEKSYEKAKKSFGKKPDEEKGDVKEELGIVKEVGKRTSKKFVYANEHVQENLMMENWRRFLNEETDFERQAAAESQKKEYLFNDLVRNTNDELYEIDWMVSDETVSYGDFKEAVSREYANDAKKNPVIIQTIEEFEKNLADKQKYQDMSNADAAGYHTGEY